jgi:hypothetical protein
MKGGVTVFRARLLSLCVTAAPFALLVAKLSLGTKTGGMNDGGFTLS